MSGPRLAGATTIRLADMSAPQAIAEDRPVVAVANRLPVHLGDKGWELSPGGLVTALRPVMASHPGAWVGWDGGTRGMPGTLPDSAVRLLPNGHWPAWTSTRTRSPGCTTTT